MLSIPETAKTDDLVPLLVADVFHLAGAFRRLGSRIAKKAGHTQGRWQLLSVISDGARTVAQIARRLGLARQSVQRTANEAVRLKLARYVENPDHKRSPLVEITEQGRKTLAVITREAERSHAELGAHFKSGEMATALRVIRRMCEKVDGGGGRKAVRRRGR